MPNILSLTSPGTELLAYPANEGGIGERWPHIVELEVVHVVEELWESVTSVTPPEMPPHSK